MLRSSRCLTRQRSLVFPILFQRGARTRSKPSTNQKPIDPTTSLNSQNDALVKKSEELLNLQNKYQEQFHTQVSRRGMEKVEVEQDEVLLDMLNNAKPDSLTDRRFTIQKEELRKMDNEDDKLRSIVVFLLNEIQFSVYEFEQYQNDVNVGAGSVNEDFSMLAEFEFKKLFINSNEDDEYLKFRVLNQIMEDLLKKRGGLLILPPEITVEVFKLSQFIINDEELRLKVRYNSGKLIYGLKKFEFDYLSESQFIESLIIHGENDYANELLLKKCEKVNKRFWYELMIFNHLEVNNLKKAEDMVEEIERRFGSKYLDSRIFQLFIDKYSETNNVEKLNYWIDRFKSLILDNDGIIEDDKEEELTFNLDEEIVISLLEEQKPPKKSEFTKILEILFKEYDFFKPKLIYEMIEFYLSLENTEVKELSPLLNTYKLKFNSKILPMFEKTNDSKLLELKELLIINENDVENSESVLLNELFSNKTTKLQTALNQIQNLIETNGSLSSSEVYHIFQIFLQNGKIEECYQILNQMEKNTINDSNNTNDMILPMVESKHYLPFLSYYGKAGKYKEFSQILKNFQQNPISKFQYNPIILTQIFASLTRMQKYKDCNELINDVLTKDIHKNDPNYIKSEKFKERKMYSAIWQSLRYTLMHTKNHVKSDINHARTIHRYFPNMRLLFMKMIHDKVIPTSKDYENIISCFLVNQDKYSVLCLLKYLAQKHHMKLSPKMIKLLNRYNAKFTVNDNGTQPEHDEEIVESDPLQQEILDELHLRPIESSNSLDPFKKATTQSSSQKDTKLIDVDDSSPSPSTIKEDNSWRHHYYLTTVSIIEHDTTKRFDRLRAAKVFKDFELLPPTQQEIQLLLEEYKDVKQPVLWGRMR